MILLFSGGVDSFIAYHWLNWPLTVYFDLGTPYSRKEIMTVKLLINSTKVEKCLDLSSRQVGENAYIPFRNLYLAMLACKYSDEIVIVGIKGDNVSDKTPEIFLKFSNILSEMEDREIRVTSPFWNRTKDEIVEWYVNEGLSVEDLLDTTSCYSPGNLTYCGECPSCYRKWVAFYNNNIKIDFYNGPLMASYLTRAKEGHYIAERNRSIIKATKDYLRGH
jgi:7-cyano-7-deazaguanine synthase in queuosine biosynthesis